MSSFITQTIQHMTSFKRNQMLIRDIFDRGSPSPEPGVRRWAEVYQVFLMVG